MGFGIKISKADRLFSLYIRNRDGWKCQKCLRQYEPLTNGLQNSHFYGRGNKSVRFDPENCDALCTGCHTFWGRDRQGVKDYEAFKIKQLGQKRFDLLTWRYHHPCRVDEALIVLWCKEELKKYGKAA